MNYRARPSKEYVAHEKARAARARVFLIDEREPSEIRKSQRSGRRTRLEVLEREVRAECAKRFERRFGFAWDERWARWVAGLDARTAAWVANGRAARGRSTGLARKLSLRSDFVVLWDERPPFALPLRSDGSSRFLSANELALVSLLGGRWPDGLKITTSTRPRDVIAAETRSVKDAIDLHGRRSLSWNLESNDIDEKKRTDVRTPHIGRGKRRVPSRP